MKLTLIPAQYLEQSTQYPELALCRIASQEKGLYRIISAEGDQLSWRRYPVNSSMKQPPLRITPLWATM